MRTRSPEQWRDEVVQQLESMHMLMVEADAFLSAFDDAFRRGSWPAARDSEHWRDVNRMDCFLERLSLTLDNLLIESRQAIKIAMQRAA